jgi:transcriptional regulator with XRE-family HTH domain
LALNFYLNQAILPLDICQLSNYNTIMDRGDRDNLGEVIRQQRLMMALTLQELATKSGVSSSHLGRIERGERYPSARTLQKIAKPLGFEETLPSNGVRVDPYVAAVLSQEPVNVQRAVVGILTILKSIAEGVTKESAAHN